MTSTLLRSANAGFFKNINRNLITINKLKDKCKLKSIASREGLQFVCDCKEFKCKMGTLLDQIEQVDSKKSFDYREEVEFGNDFVNKKLPCGVLRYDDDKNISCLRSEKYELIVNI